MKVLGYSSGWINLIKECVITTSFLIFINGEPSGIFNAQKGLRQSDPISHFFFILSMKLISKLIAISEVQHNFEGIQISRNNPPNSHLLFTDDLVIFGKVNERNTQAISKSFRKLSGLVRTKNKSQQIINIHHKKYQSRNQSSNQSNNAIQNILIRMKYLELPISFSKAKKEEV